MMRKLTKLATTTLAAAAFLAAASAPANADQEFLITDPDGAYCDPYCDDTGYTGTLPNVTFAGTACDASFDIRVGLYGELETQNTEVLCPNGSGGYYNVEECDHTWGPAQIVIPDQGQPNFNLDICLRQGAWPQGVGGILVNHNITFDIYNGPRSWHQAGTDTVTDNDPNSGPFPAITNAYLQDNNPDDNVRTEIL